MTVKHTAGEEFGSMSLRGPAKLGWACVVDKSPRQILAQQSS